MSMPYYYPFFFLLPQESVSSVFETKIKLNIFDKLKQDYIICMELTAFYPQRKRTGFKYASPTLRS